jgi:uncharacterized phiE125 gp8 family phage protein
MSLILTDPPATEPLSLADAKAHLRLSHTDDDTYIANLIIAARRQIEQRTGLCMILQNWSVYYDRWPVNDSVRIPLDPVLAINDIKIYGDDDAFAIIDSAHYFIDRAAWPVRIVLRHGRSTPQPGRSANGIEINLTAGFGATAASVPQDVKQAILLTVAAWFGNRGDEQGGSLPLMALGLIAPYRTVRLA